MSNACRCVRAFNGSDGGAKPGPSPVFAMVFVSKQSAKHSVKDLRKQASAIKQKHCPATSKMNRKELISYIEKHR